MPRFIHLRVHTAYSLLEGAIQIKALPGLCRDRAMPAVAVTDRNNLFAALEFSEVAARAGIQPIIGCQIDIFEDLAGEPAPTSSLVLLAQNQVGYSNLIALSSGAFLSCGDVLPHVTRANLSARAEGLICLAGGSDGPVGRALQDGREDTALAEATWLRDQFGDRLYMELQRHGSGPDGRTVAEAQTEPGLISLAHKLDLPLVATNDAYFASPDMFESHDALICIADGAYVDQQEPRRRFTPEHGFKSQDEMAALFSDLPEALASTVEIAQRCSYRARTCDPILPRFAEDEIEELRRQSLAGLEERLAVIPHAAPLEDYRKRLDYELGVIESMGFPGYFLIVADFIKWSKDRSIPVGPGRGSGAGSLVAYALTITDLDPLRYNLLFERFLNPERVSMPDFDIDFCMERREEVITYVQEKYGRDRVAQIITFGALLSKAAVRDVGRVLQMPYGQVDRLSKMIPVEGVKPVSVEKALADEPRLREAAKTEEVVERLLLHASKLEGLLRNASTHAAGVVIGDRPLQELVPLYLDPRSDMPATQFNMKWVEQAGLVKFDFLGLKTLTVIQNAVDILNAQGVKVDISAIPLDDDATFALYAAAQTVGVFQVEGAGMKDALRQMKPTSIDDIIALVALYRPGPMENIPKFCNVKNGREDRENLHPLIDRILDETQGIIVYQEQVMQIAQDMAGYSLGGADLLRRAMGKKIKEAMDAERPKFLAGAAENQVEKAKAQEVWDLLEKFANYGFNKSHAAAYAVVSYQTAWLKANHPVAFMAAAMNCDLHLTDKLNTYIEEVRRLEIDVVPPCVNRSDAMFSVGDNKIFYAMGGLKNVGVEAMKLIVSERTENGPYTDVFDFARRVDLRRIGKRPLEMLARAGGLDQLDANRRKMLESADTLIAYSNAAHSDRNSAQVSLFGDAADALPAPRLSQPEDWLPTERLTEEHSAVGFYLSGHPLDDYMAPLARKRVVSYADLIKRAQSGAAAARIAGSVAGVQERKSARGNRFAFVQLSDPSGLYEVTLFSDVLDEARGFLEPGMNVVLSVEAQIEGEQLRLRARGVQPVDSVVADAAAVGIKIFVEEEKALASVSRRLVETAEGSRRNSGPVNLVLRHVDLPGEVELTLPDAYAITPQVRSAIRAIEGVLHIEEF